MILHLGAQDRFISENSYKRKKQLLVRALKLTVPNGDFAQLLLQAMYLIEQSGEVNAGTGCSLT
jgi:hypothetical protein